MSRPLSTGSPRSSAAAPSALALLAALLAAFSSLAVVGAASAEASQPRRASPDADRSSAVVVYLVRHAEKADDGTEDPPLTLAGRIRVQVLRHLLDGTGVSQVHTTDWKRTRETARPIAEGLGVETSVYDANDPVAFADRLATTPARHLVVGHSNTIPRLVAELGGDPGQPIADLEYDRLYQIVLVPGQAPVTTLLRFGEPYVDSRGFGLRSPWGSRTRGPPSP